MIEIIYCVLIGVLIACFLFGAFKEHKNKKEETQKTASAKELRNIVYHIWQMSSKAAPLKFIYPATRALLSIYVEYTNVAYTEHNVVTFDLYVNNKRAATFAEFRDENYVNHYRYFVPKTVDKAEVEALLQEVSKNMSDKYIKDNTKVSILGSQE